MTRRLALTVVVASLAFGWLSFDVVRAQDARAVIAEAFEQRRRDPQHRRVPATGFDFALSQAYNPSSPWPKFINKSYTRAVDSARRRRRSIVFTRRGEPAAAAASSQSANRHRAGRSSSTSTPWAAVGSDAAARIHPRSDSQQRDARDANAGRQAISRLPSRARTRPGEQLSERSGSERVREGSTTRYLIACCLRRSTPTTETSAE